MRLGPEVQLMLLAAALYVYDSTFMLTDNEGIVGFRRGHWFARIGSRLDFRGKRLYLANLLTPHRQIYRLRWDYENPHPGAAGSLLAARPELHLLAPLVWAVFLGMFVFLPLALFVAPNTANTVGAIATLYSGVLGLVCILLFRGAVLGLAPARRRALAFECIACPPLAINALRKISLSTPCEESLVAAAHRLLDDESCARFDIECVRRLDEAIDFEDPNTARSGRLAAARAFLMPKGQESS